MSATFVARPLVATAGWVAAAHHRGLRVTSRGRRFGRIEYLVKDAGAIVQFQQAPESRLASVMDDPSLAQAIILRQLERIGVIEITDATDLAEETPDELAD